MENTSINDIPQIIISTTYQTREMRSATPIQAVRKTDLERMQALQLSDAAKHVAGVTVKDYGGVGGLKTISIRSMGAEHTAVGYDGIAITNSQTGQIDMGRCSLANVNAWSLSNGQSENIFQSAHLFTSAGLVNRKTLTH